MSRIFISYRRRDSEGYVLWMHDKLVEAFGQEQVFMDVSIEPGDDFVDVLDAALSNCEVMLVVIGPQWISVTNDDGQRRLDDPDDYVRYEIISAMQRGVLIIPALVGGARMPGDNILPDELASLARRQAVEVHRRKFMPEFINTLKSKLEQLHQPPAVSNNGFCEVRGGTDTLSEENLAVLQRFGKVRRLDIKERVTEGSSGSKVFVVDAFLREGSRRPQPCFLKIHHSQGETPRIRHEQAYATNLKTYMPEVVDATPWDEQTKQIALLYSNKSRGGFNSLGELLKGKAQQSIALIGAVCEALIEWNQDIDYEHLTPPKLLIRALSHSENEAIGYRRLQHPKASIYARLDQEFGLRQDVPLVRFEGVGFDTRQILPNPLAYAADPRRWGRKQHTQITWPCGHVHGDLNVRNILALEGARGASGLALIDFDTYDDANLFFLDFAQMELGIVLRLCSPTNAENRQELVALSEYLAASVELTAVPDLAVKSVGINQILMPIRETIARFCEGDRDLIRAFWIARMAAGLELSRKTRASKSERVFALLFAADSLHTLLDEIRYGDERCSVHWPDDEE